MPCALEINSNGRFKWEHVESCSSTTKNFISALPQCRDILKPLYLRHQCLWPPNWQDGELPWGAPSKKLHDHLIMWSSEITWQNKTIISTRSVYGHQPCRIVTYLEGCLPMKLHGSRVMWSCVSTWQIKVLYLHYHHACSHQSWQDVNLSRGAPTHNVTWFFN